MSKLQDTLFIRVDAYSWLQVKMTQNYTVPIYMIFSKFVLNLLMDRWQSFLIFQNGSHKTEYLYIERETKLQCLVYCLQKNIFTLSEPEAACMKAVRGHAFMNCLHHLCNLV